MHGGLSIDSFVSICVQLETSPKKSKVMPYEIVILSVIIIVTEIYIVALWELAHQMISMLA